MSRLRSGGLIDRATTLRFRFDGREYTGHPVGLTVTPIEQR